METGGLWKEIIKFKYETWRSLTQKSNPRLESTWWRDLKMVYREDMEGSWFDESVRWKVKNVKCIKFWEDKRSGERSFMNRFLDYIQMIFLKTNTQMN